MKRDIIFVAGFFAAFMFAGISFIIFGEPSKTPVQRIDEFCASVNSKTYRVAQMTYLTGGRCENGSEITIEN